MIIMEDVTKTYTSGVPALNGINLHVQKGEFVFIVGKIGERHITVGKFHFIGADEEAGERLHEDGRLVVSAFKEDT